MLFSFAFAYIDVFLMDYCLKLIHEKDEGIEKKKFNIIILISTVLFFVALHFPLLYFLCLFIEISLTLCQYYELKDSFINSVKISIVRLLIDIICILIFEWLFEIILISKYNDMFSFLKLLIVFISKYFQYFIFILWYQKKYKKNLANMRYFKTISLILSTLYGFTIIYTNEFLFYFESIGRTMIFTLIIYNVILVVFDRYQMKHDEIEREYAEKRKEYEIIELKNRMQEEYNVKIQEEQNNIRNIKHNIKNYLCSIYGYIEQGESETAMKQIDGILQRLTKPGQLTNYTGHIGIDSILDEKMAIARRKNFKIEEKYEMVNPGIVETTDLVIILGSALDNAIEALDRIEDDTEKEMYVRIGCNDSYLIIVVGNTVKDGHNIDFDHTSKESMKKDHGYGVNDIKRLAMKYDGYARYEVIDDYVKVNIMLYTVDD